jgi:phage terminase small subunit
MMRAKSPKSKLKRDDKKGSKTVKTSKKYVSEPPKSAQKMSLNKKQQLFVVEYLIDLNATQAAIRAGYSKRTAFRIGAENIQKPAIKTAIDTAIEERKKRVLVTADEVVRELALIGMADMKDFITIDEAGAVSAIPLENLAEGKSRIIKKVKEKRVIKTVQGTKDKPDGDQVLDATFEFELCDKVKSLELLSRHLGLLHDKHEVGLNASTIEMILSALPPDLADLVRAKLMEM